MAASLTIDRMRGGGGVRGADRGSILEPTEGDGGVMVDSGHDESDQQWFYCLKHKTAEQGIICGSKNRLGPYATEAEASRALEIARERNKSWDEDPHWQ